jgi:hypothetical protein
MSLRMFSDSGEASGNGQNPSLVTLNENVESVSISTFGAKERDPVRLPYEPSFGFVLP